MRIRWTDPAIESLRNLHGYIAKDSEIYASNFIQRIVLAVEKLELFPRLGRVVPEADEETTRELLYQNYRIIYRIKGELIQILTVIHGRRELGSVKPAPWEID
jgi:plasmid stabilization system protein ParE